MNALSNLSPFDGFSSSFGFFLGVSFWMEDDLWLQREARRTDEHQAGGAETRGERAEGAERKEQGSGEGGIGGGERAWKAEGGSSSGEYEEQEEVREEQKESRVSPLLP
jgi:hypothetical protein